ncbi:TorF family putative porin [Sphingomonas sp. LaA6.9]|uniref:TorF family putative porin n=1 Tax=Sphingomonas sp. LaA6.9 TaxID=2919914 RepID=UPI001F4FC241|nr:TorF family putative porin [Sphingomonas sp. LaA6.9]MCJ8156710.1 TorF family putative porin [Sphingomonas sp. LaA6.9]
MRTSITGLTALALAMLATPALAQDEAAAPEETSSITISGGATVVTDYRFRGISQTDKNFALQGTISLSHESGFYATVWGSTIDDYVAAGGDQELDLILGWKKTFGGTTVDLGVLYYYYPGAEEIVPGYDSDFVEPYVAVSHTFGPVTGKLTAAYAPSQSALSVGNGSEDNFYLAGDLSGGIPGTPLSLSAHVGHSFGPSYLTIGDEYTDWSLGATYTWKNLSFGVSYVDTDKALFNPISGKNVSKAGVVGSIGVAF